jgi:hypothetical protein
MQHCRRGTQSQLFWILQGRNGRHCRGSRKRIWLVDGMVDAATGNVNNNEGAMGTENGMTGEDHNEGVV